MQTESTGAGYLSKCLSTINNAYNEISKWRINTFLVPYGKVGREFIDKMTEYRVFQKFVPIVNCILHKEFNASLGKCKLIQVGNLSK